MGPTQDVRGGSARGPHPDTIPGQSAGDPGRKIRVAVGLDRRDRAEPTGTPVQPTAGRWIQPQRPQLSSPIGYCEMQSVG